MEKKSSDKLLSTTWGSYSELLDWVKLENWMPEVGQRREPVEGDQVGPKHGICLGLEHNPPAHSYELNKATVLATLNLTRKTIRETVGSKKVWWWMSRNPDDGRGMPIYYVKVWEVEE